MSKTYDPAKIDAVFASILLNEGIADGTWLTVTPTTPGFSSKAGVGGDVVWARSHDRRATVVLTVFASSPVNSRLSALYNADRKAVNGQGVGAFFLQDRAGTTVGRASKGRIVSEPTITYAAEVEAREWTIELADWEATHGEITDD